MSDADPVPAYEATSPGARASSLPLPSTSSATQNHASSGPPSETAGPSSSLSVAGNPDLNTTRFYGGGGVRIPLSATEKEREDLRSLSHLASFGVQFWVRGFDE